MFVFSAIQTNVRGYFEAMIHRINYNIKSLPTAKNLQEISERFLASSISEVQESFSTFNVSIIPKKKQLENSLTFPIVDRMPVPIGNFISRHVYNEKLQSKHAVTSMSCLSFINVPESREVKAGFSWKVILFIG